MLLSFPSRKLLRSPLVAFRNVNFLHRSTDFQSATFKFSHPGMWRRLASRRRSWPGGRCARAANPALARMHRSTAHAGPKQRNGSSESIINRAFTASASRLGNQSRAAAFVVEGRGARAPPAVIYGFSVIGLTWRARSRPRRSH